MSPIAAESLPRGKERIMKMLLLASLLSSAMSCGGAGYAPTAAKVAPTPPPETEFAAGRTRYGFMLPRHEAWQLKRNVDVVAGQPAVPLTLLHPETGARWFVAVYEADDVPLAEASREVAIKVGLKGAKISPLGITRFGDDRAGFRFTYFKGDIAVLSGQMVLIRMRGDAKNVIFVQGLWPPSRDEDMALEMNAALATLRVKPP